MLKLNWGNRTPPNQSPAIVATWVATKAAITALFPALLPIRYLTPESDSSISSPARGRLAILYNLSEAGTSVPPPRAPSDSDRCGSRLRAPDRRNLFTIGFPVLAAMTDVESRGLFI